MSLITALGSVAAAGIGAGTASAKNRKSYKYTKMLQQQQHELNKQLMDYQNEYNINYWNMQNEYNSPASQMQRYKEAGLNPALMYSEGVSSSSSGNAGPAPAAASVPTDLGISERGAAYDVAASQQWANFAANATSQALGIISQLKDIKKQDQSLTAGDIDISRAEESLIDIKTRNKYVDRRYKTEADAINADVINKELQSTLLRWDSALKNQAFNMSGGRYTTEDASKFRELSLRLAKSNAINSEFRHELDKVVRALNSRQIEHISAMIRELNQKYNFQAYLNKQYRTTGEGYGRDTLGAFYGPVNDIWGIVTNLLGAAGKFGMASKMLGPSLSSDRKSYSRTNEHGGISPNYDF